MAAMGDEGAEVEDGDHSMGGGGGVHWMGLVNDGSPDPLVLKSPCRVAEGCNCFESFRVVQDVPA